MDALHYNFDCVAKSYNQQLNGMERFISISTEYRESFKSKDLNGNLKRLLLLGDFEKQTAILQQVFFYEIKFFLPLVASQLPQSR